MRETPRPVFNFTGVLFNDRPLSRFLAHRVRRSMRGSVGDFSEIKFGPRAIKFFGSVSVGVLTAECAYCINYGLVKY